MSYAMMVDEYNELVRQQVSASEEAEQSGISNEMESKLEQWKERADEYSHKFQALSEGGIGELAGMSGLKNTYNNLFRTGYFTVNHINIDDIEDAHHTSAKYPNKISEFDKTKFEPEFLDNFKAPFVKSSKIKFGCKYFKRIYNILGSKKKNT